MSGFLEIIKCIHCKLILQSPINLPCGHTICQKHITDQNCHLFACLSCRKTHTVPGNGFPAKLSLVSFIDMKLASYNNALNACNSLKSTIYEMALSKIDQKSQFEREITELKSGIRSQRDELIKEITSKSEQMINEIEIYENKCQNLLETVSDSFEKANNQVVDENKEKLEKWLKEFSNLQTTSEVNLEIISEQCELERVKLSELFKKAKGTLLKLYSYKANWDLLRYFKNFVETQRFLNNFNNILFHVK
jgi:hypothetical protein